MGSNHSFYSQILHTYCAGPAASAIEYHDVVFEMSGMGTREHPVTEYEGPPTAKNNLKWYEMLNGKVRTHYFP